MPRSVTTPEDAYWFKFQATMKDHMGADGAEKLKLFYKSQCLKDDAMAESSPTIWRSTRISESRRASVRAFPFRLRAGNRGSCRAAPPLLRTAVITMETMYGEEKPDDLCLVRRAHLTCSGRSPILPVKKANQLVAPPKRESVGGCKGTGANRAKLPQGRFRQLAPFPLVFESANHTRNPECRRNPFNLTTPASAGSEPASWARRWPGTCKRPVTRCRFSAGLATRPPG